MEAFEKGVFKTPPLTINKGESFKKELQEAEEEKFQPKGAMAFFILLVILGFIIWFGIYFLMLERI